MLSRWMDMSDTLSMMNAFEKQMNHIFDTPRTRTPVSRGGLEITLADRGDDLVLVAEVPGLDRQDLELSVEGDLVTLRGERKKTVPDGYEVTRSERGVLRLMRQIELPCRVNPDAATATLELGVLTVTLPKASDSKPRKIPIVAAETPTTPAASA